MGINGKYDFGQDKVWAYCSYRPFSDFFCARLYFYL
jgi:hypothetical protein